MKSSVVVPCHSTHCRFIMGVINYYKEQSKLPYEMIFVCSNIDKKLLNEIEKKREKIKEMNLSFQVHFKVFKKRQFAGLNRKIGANFATGDIVIFQDADDIPHKDRINIIEYFFQKYKPVFIGHNFIMRNSNKFKEIQKEKKIDIKFSLYNTYYDRFFSHGNIALLRSIIPRIHKWYTNTRRTQDQLLNQYIMTKFKKNLIIEYPLILYRDNYSTNYK
jgi:cellulose synthase/poly-beta-1,6-N-acetylglucosamine synthase-like glycosyltransferase